MTNDTKISDRDDQNQKKRKKKRISVAYNKDNYLSLTTDFVEYGPGIVLSCNRK